MASLVVGAGPVEGAADGVSLGCGWDPAPAPAGAAGDASSGATGGVDGDAGWARAAGERKQHAAAAASEERDDVMMRKLQEPEKSSVSRRGGKRTTRRAAENRGLAGTRPRSFTHVLVDKREITERVSGGRDRFRTCDIRLVRPALYR